jgi:hypothetical protein
LITAYKEGDSVNGHKLTKCNRCSRLIYFVKDEYDKWQLYNPDGSKHEEALRKELQQNKRTITIGKLFSQNYNSVRVEISEEFDSSGDWLEQWKKVDAMVEQALEKERAKILLEAQVKK